MKLFTVGPVQMFDHTMKVRSMEVPYFRTPEFSEMMLENERLLKKCMYAPEDARAIFLTASGSGAMEAAVMNCLSASDKVLIISGGTFGERFETICNIHEIPYETLRLGLDEALEECHLAAYADRGFTALLVNLHETYTGQLYDIQMISDFCSRNGLYLIVDAISTFLCDDYNMEKYKIDVTIVSSQKGLCLSPGLSCIVLNGKMAEKVSNMMVKSLYFNFKDYLCNMKRGQTPYTPCVGTLLELYDMLLYLDRKGVENHVNEVRERCRYFRGKLGNLPVYLPKYKLSNGISPIRFERDIAMDLFSYLKNDKDIMLNPVGGELGKYSLRVAHIGNLSFEDYDILLDEMERYLNNL